MVPAPPVMRATRPFRSIFQSLLGIAEREAGKMRQMRPKRLTYSGRDKRALGCRMRATPA
jgi:hypothetical protein